MSLDELVELVRVSSSSRRMQICAGLDDETLADALELLPEQHQVEIITSLESLRSVAVLEQMQPDDAADALSELPGDVAEELLRLMTEQEEAQEEHGQEVDATAAPQPQPQRDWRAARFAFDRALTHLPEEERARYSIDWTADLAYVTGRAHRFLFSAGLWLWSAPRITRDQRRLAASGSTLPKPEN